MREEEQSGSIWLLLPQPVRKLPADLTTVIVLTLATLVVVLVPVINETPLRVVLGLIFVLFLPGYAFIAALFPEAGSAPKTASEDTTEALDQGEHSTTDGNFTNLGDRGIDGIERVALSFGLSIAIVPLIGLMLNFTPWGIRLLPILFAVSGFTLAATAIATVRRWSLPETERFRVPYREWISRGREEVFNPDTRLDGVLNVLLAVSILLAVGAVGFAIVVPPDGERFTEFYILTEDENDDLVAANYPTEFELGESQPVVVGIGNNEHETLEYTVVVQLQEMEHVINESAEGQSQAGETDGLTENENGTGINETVILEQDELDRFTTSELPHNETLHITQDIQPTMTGENLRVQFLLYRGEPPEEPTRENAYRDVHLWIDVHEEESTMSE